MAHNLIFDAWTPLSFKRALGSRTQPGVSWLAPTWVGRHDRRLQAYKLLQAYLDNAGREFLATDSEADRAQHREYGDAALVRDRIVAALLGEGQEVVVEGADQFDPTGEGENDGDSKAAFDLQEWFREWADKERLGLKVFENERNAVGLGDGVYTLGWSPDKKRVRLRVWDPGFYFPVLEDNNEDDFPKRIHIAWEVETDKLGQVAVRRLTWTLAPIQGVQDPNGKQVVNKVRTSSGVTVEVPIPLDGDELDPETGTITRTYPWNDEPTNLTCFYSDATWIVPASKAGDVNDFTESEAIYATDADGEIRNRDLQIDFIPVIHEPNTVALINHYGRSSIATVLQILDDLANADTDLQAASATAGKPVLVLSGVTMGGASPTYRAGQMIEVGADGGLDALDTSKSLDALIKYVEFLLARLSVNGRVPESVLGRIKPSEVPSGVALALSFGPLASMVSEMRLVRDEKYPVLLRFVHRMARAGQQQGVPEQEFPAKVEFGSYLPQDRAAAVTEVTTLLSTKPTPAISLETAVRLLQSAGFPIDEATEEVQRIQHRDFVGATDLLAATGDEDGVFDYLDRKKPAVTLRPAPPTVEAPTGPPPTTAD